MNTEQAARVADISRTPITLLPVVSSQIAEIGHDPNTNRLAIRFQPKPGFVEGPLYYYANVDANLFLQFQGADSIGQFFYKNIKPNAEEFPYVKISEGRSSDDTSQSSEPASKEAA